jgi:ribonuclease HI
VNINKKKSIKREEILKIYTDGASRGNPGASAYAFVFVKDDSIFHQKSEFIGESTNNTAEYEAVIHALEDAEKHTRWRVEVYSDSELVIKQINKEYRIKKEHLSKLCGKVYSLRQKFEDVKFKAVRRNNKFVKEADRLCNKCLDEN